MKRSTRIMALVDSHGLDLDEVFAVSDRVRDSLLALGREFQNEGHKQPLALLIAATYLQVECMDECHEQAATELNRP